MLAPEGEWEKIAVFNDMADLIMLSRGVKIPRKKTLGFLKWLARRNL